MYIALRPRRSQTCQRHLRVCGIRKAHGSDQAVAPWLCDDPSASIESVRTLAQILRELPLRVVASAAILKNHDVAVSYVVLRHLGAGLRLRIVRRKVSKAGDVAPVGCALHECRKSPGRGLAIPRRSIHIRRQMNTVTHPHADVALEERIERTLRLTAAGCSRETRQAQRQGERREGASADSLVTQHRRPLRRPLIVGQCVGGTHARFGAPHDTVAANASAAQRFQWILARSLVARDGSRNRCHSVAGVCRAHRRDRLFRAGDGARAIRDQHGRCSAGGRRFHLCRARQASAGHPSDWRRGHLCNVHSLGTRLLRNAAAGHRAIRG